MDLALSSWRDDYFVNSLWLLAYACGIALIVIAATGVSRLLSVTAVIEPAGQPEWIEVERPNQAFALNMPEAVGMASSYNLRRRISGGGRKDVIGLGDPHGPAPFLMIEIYRPGGDIGARDALMNEASARAVSLEAKHSTNRVELLKSKFGSLTIVPFVTNDGTSRHCLGFGKVFDSHRLQISGQFCHTGSAFIARATLNCALDRLTLVAAGSDGNIAALFAKAERNRTFCGQRNLLYAATPKY